MPPGHKTVRCPCGVTLEIDATGKRKSEPASLNLFDQPELNTPAPLSEPDPLGNASWMDEVPSVSHNAYSPTAGAPSDFYSAPPPSSGTGSSSDAFSSPSSKKSPANNYLAQAESERQRSHDSQHTPVDCGFNGGMGTDVLMLVGAVAWFFGGLAYGYIFFYPPVLLVTGMITFIKSIGD